MSKTLFNFVKQNQLFSRAIIAFTIIFLTFSWLLPFMVGQADASQLTSRSLTLGTAQPSTSTTYTYTFTYVSSASAIQSVKLVACTTATATYGLASVNTVSGCTVPTGININNASTVNTNTGSWTNTTQFSRDGTGGGNCNPSAAGASNNVLCAKRTQAAAESAASKTMAWTLSTNPSTVNTAFFIGIYLYSDTGWATPTDSGTVASAVVQTLTINAAVVEVLNFCVGNTAADDMTTDPANSGNHDCTAVSGTSVNLGVLDTGHVNVTPVSTNCSASDCSKNGLVMIRSNAINGATIYYDPVAQGGTNHTKALRIGTNTCDATDPSTDVTDSCINSAGWNGSVATHTTLTAGTEKFGMTIAGINCGSTTAYSCTGSSNSNLTRSTNYNGNGGTTYTSESNQSITTTTGNLYAWDEAANPIQIASSSSSSTKVLDDESLILKFAGTPSITTPFGSYTAKSDFIAVAVY